MSKEVKIGLAIIGVLLVVFGMVLFNRLRGPSLATQDAEESAAEADGAGATDGAGAGDDAEHSEDEADPPVVESEGESRRAPASGADLFASSRLAARAGATANDGRDEPAASDVPDAGDDENAEDGEGEDSGDDASSYDSYDSYERRPSAARRGASGAAPSTAATAQVANGEEDSNPLRATASSRTAAATSDPEDGEQAANDEHDDAEVHAAATAGGAAAVAADEETEGHEPEEADHEAHTAGGSRAPAQATERPAGQTETATAANPDEYEVQRGEDLWMISESLFGTDIYARAIYAHNRAAYPNPDAIQAGDVLVIPDAAELERLYPDTFPRETATAQAGTTAPRPAGAAADSAESGDEYMAEEETGTGAAAARPESRRATDDRVYVVRQGETIFDVARNELGKARRWVEIYELNRDVLGDDFQAIPTGTELLLPPENKVDATARRPGETSR